MHRIDTSGATEDGLYQDTADPKTRFDAAAGNAIQEEICGVIEGAGGVLDKGNHGQLLAAILAIVDRANPAGVAKTFTGDTCPAGHVFGDGAEHPRTGETARLWAHAQSSGMMAEDAGDWAANPGKYYIGNGVDTFNVPDFRGVSFRVLDGGAGIDPDRELGSRQLGQNQAHKHISGDASDHGSERYGGVVTGVSVTASQFGSAPDSTRGFYSSTEGGSETRVINDALPVIISL